MSRVARQSIKIVASVLQSWNIFPLSFVPSATRVCYHGLLMSHVRKGGLSDAWKTISKNSHSGSACVSLSAFGAAGDGAAHHHRPTHHADAADAAPLREKGLSATITETVMRDAQDRERLASEVLALAGRME